MKKTVEILRGATNVKIKSRRKSIEIFPVANFFNVDLFQSSEKPIKKKLKKKKFKKWFSIIRKHNANSEVGQSQQIYIFEYV